MNKSIFTTVLAAALLASAAVEAAQLKCKLVMGNDKSWDGYIVKREGDWIEFLPGTSTRPIRLGASTIVELEFDIAIDEANLNKLNRNREYERIIGILNRTLEPFKAYNDIPSNVVPYKALLMELHYKVGNFSTSTALAAELVADDRDPELQAQGRLYQALTLIADGKVAETEALMKEFGWDQELDENTPPEQLFVMGKLQVLKKDYASAMENVAKVIAFNSQDPEWMQPAELFCAEVYTELGMYDSAEEVIRQISLLYKNTNEDDLAQKLKIKIEQLRAEKELQELQEESE